MPRVPARKLVRPLSLEQLERREMLSVTFVDSGQQLGGELVSTAAFGDLDGDGDLDAIVSGNPTQVWFNDGRGAVTLCEKVLVGQPPDTDDDYFSWPVRLGDLDADGDLDALVGFWEPNSDVETWFAEIWLNVAGGMFTRTVFPDFSAYGSVDLADIDADGDLDALANGVVFLNDGAAFFESPFGACGSGQPGAGFSVFADVDNDNYPDVMTVTVMSELNVCLNSRNDASPNFAPYTELRGAGAPFAVGDLNGDSYPDVVGSQKSFLNDGKGDFIPGNGSRGFVWPVLGDIDNDGDLDAVVLRSGECEVWINDGSGAFIEAIPIGASVLPEGLQYLGGPILADVDGDEDLDVFANGRLWLNGEDVPISLEPGDVDGERCPAPELLAGDANDDWIFDQLDILQVLITAKYLTCEPATWEEGDWNGDGVFDQGDIIAALRTSSYLQGPYVDSALAEPGEQP